MGLFSSVYFNYTVDLQSRKIEISKGLFTLGLKLKVFFGAFFDRETLQRGYCSGERECFISSVDWQGIHVSALTQIEEGAAELFV